MLLKDKIDENEHLKSRMMKGEQQVQSKFQPFIKSANKCLRKKRQRRGNKMLAAKKRG